MEPKRKRWPLKKKSMVDPDLMLKKFTEQRKSGKQTKKKIRKPIHFHHIKKF